MRWQIVIAGWMVSSIGCAVAAEQPLQNRYQWTQLTERAGFEPSYNFPVHVAADGRFIALHSQGTWISRDGITWQRGELPPSGMNSAYLGYVQHQGASWALGRIRGNYQGFSIEPVIQRTADYRRWQRVGRSETLPKLVFYAIASFRGALWMLGGFDGQTSTNAIWKSSDGLQWQRVVETAPWTPRANAKAVVFRDQLVLIGGGQIDGEVNDDVWASDDGIHWTQQTGSMSDADPVGYAPVVFDGRLWLVGANRSGSFSSEMLVSNDLHAWQAVGAPWSPRGGVAVWATHAGLFMTGGKFSRERNGATEFIYRNDVWRMLVTEQ